jgi:hypothetical protein
LFGDPPIWIRAPWRTGGKTDKRKNAQTEPHLVRNEKFESIPLQRGVNKLSVPVRIRWAGLVDAMARDMKLTREEADTLAPRSIPPGRIAECEEVANLVAYLASDLAHFINGTMIEIDGGQQKPLMDRFRDR